jgi:hypothetical protein
MEEGLCLIQSQTVRAEVLLLSVKSVQSVRRIESNTPGQEYGTGYGHPRSARTRWPLEGGIASPGPEPRFRHPSRRRLARCRTGNMAGH